MPETLSVFVPVKGTTKVVGIFGDPVTYTLSPKMHNHAFRSLGLDFIYVPFQVRPAYLKDAVLSIRSLGLVGVNVTIPHKEAVIPFLDELTPLACAIGSVNTIWNKGGKLVGHNTDALGFLSSLKEEGKFNPENKKVVILGAGGTARAVSVAFIEAGIKKLVIVNRSKNRAETLVSKIREIAPRADIHASILSAEKLQGELRDADLFVNATPTGLDSEAITLSAEKLLSPHLFVFDCVYAKTTPLLLAAQRVGASCLGGLGMLIRQGALSFSLWTGEDPPVELMREALTK